MEGQLYYETDKDTGKCKVVHNGDIRNFDNVAESLKFIKSLDEPFGIGQIITEKIKNKKGE